MIGFKYRVCIGFVPGVGAVRTVYSSPGSTAGSILPASVGTFPDLQLSDSSVVYCVPCPGSSLRALSKDEDLR